jgi:hypothetical protein
MKKTLLLVILCLPSIMSHAQKIDKKLLYGRWDIYSIREAGISMCRDSLTQSTAAVIQARKANDSTNQLTYDDSVKLVREFTPVFLDMFKTWFNFERNGHYSALMCKHGTCKEEKSMYKWVGKDKIADKKGKAMSIVLKVISLTTSTLIMRAENSDGGDRQVEMTFTRAK